MEVREAINRGNNLLVSGSLAVIGFGIAMEIFRETEWIDRTDDIILLLLAIAVSAWYLSGSNRFQRSFVPFGLLVIALITKIIWLFIEIGDPDAVGDEFGLLPVLVLLVILSGYILMGTKIRAQMK